MLVLRTNPLSTKPMKAMNRPIPTVIAVFSCCGTALKIKRRRPVAASSTMMSPLMTTRPIASCQVRICTTLTARNELMPRPAAKANGRRATRPNSTVMKPALNAVTAAS